MTTVETIEAKRQEVQTRLDSSKNQRERNLLGQFATPAALATQILECARRLHPAGAPVRFLDPAIGTGAFYSALLRAFPARQIESAVGFETDPECTDTARDLWGKTRLKVYLEDFTTATPPAREWTKPNLLICNPPYVRHHHLGAPEKLRMQRLIAQAAGVKLSGLAGLYCYFLCLCQAWMARGGLAGWLIPSEFMDVNYGQQVKDYLLSRVSLLRIHRFDPNDMQFSDALVSSAVVWIRNELPPADHAVEFTFGGSLLTPELSRTVPAQALRQESKWTRFPHRSEESPTDPTQIVLSDLFKIQRGLATGDNKFFILTRDQITTHQIPGRFLTPILPSPRYLEVDEVPAAANGDPILDRRLFLLNCQLPESEVKATQPTLWRYFQLGIEHGVRQGYLCTHRTPWYAQETRAPAPFLCTYMGRQDTGRGRPFRFILNHSQATAPNVYLMLYPKQFLQVMIKEQPTLAKSVWQALNQISTGTLTGAGRVYGGGLHKLEPKELGNVPAESLLAALEARPLGKARQMSLAMERKRLWEFERLRKGNKPCAELHESA